MDVYRSGVTQRVLSLTLEIIYLLTGEDYTIVKKTSEKWSGPHMSDAWSRTPNCVEDPIYHPLILEASTEQKILEYTRKIIKLLTGEIPVRYEDIIVNFSMDEWEYVKSHKDLYKEIMMENHQPPTSTGVSSNKEEEEVHVRCDVICKEEEEEGHEWCHQPGKEEELHARGDKTFKEEKKMLIRCDPKCKEEENKTNICPALADQVTNPESKKEVFHSSKVSPKEMACTPVTTPLFLHLCCETSNPDELSLDASSTLDPGVEYEKTSMDFTGQQRFHTSDKLFLCTDCGKSFTLKADLIQHWKIHMKDKPFQCCECGECFTSKVNCTKHFRIHRGKTPFQCSECGKCFIKKSTYCNHQRVHAGGPQYPCTKCSKSFAHKCSLVKHKRTHAGERAFSCSECGKRFSEKCDFVRHLRIHTGEKPYSCTECGKGFTQKSNLVRHQKTHII
ncbi:zinc finger protein 684-like [Ranitomeya imitator]|uniref:zinc finger protein 684-like n=1 Tax=Ranitomeya imitator TaxID=111125 RepID=UPI0037E79858